MIHVGYTDLRKRLAHNMDRANDDRDAILITRQGSEPVVMLAQREYDAMLETLYLRSSPADAERLDGAVAELDRGEGVAIVWDERAQSYKRA